MKRIIIPQNTLQSKHAYTFKEYRLTLAISLLIVAFIVLGCFVSYVTFFGLIVGLLFLLKEEENKGLMLLLFLFPFASLFKVLSITGTSFFTILEIFLVIKYAYTYRTISKKFMTTLLILIITFSLSDTMSGNLGGMSVIKIIFSIALFRIFTVVFMEKDGRYYINFYCFGLMLSCIIGGFKDKFPNIMRYYSEADVDYIWVSGSKILRYTATFSDPNYYSLAIIIAVGILIALVFSNNHSLIHVVMIPIMSVLGMLSYSKSYFLMLIIMIMVLMILLLMNKKIGMVAFVVILAVLLLFGGFFANNSIMINILSRFDERSDVNALTTGRVDIWNTYFDYIKSSYRIYLLGDGTGAVDFYGATHNMYIEIWYHIGLIGLIVYLVSYFRVMLFKKVIKHRLVNYYLFTSIAVMYFFLSGFTAYELPFYFMMAWVALNTNIVRAGEKNDR